MKKRYKRILATAALVFMLFGMTMPAFAIYNPLVDKVFGNTIITDLDTFGAPIYVSNGAITSSYESLNTGISITGDDYTPSLNLVRYQQFNDPDDSINANRIAIKLEGELVSGENLNIDAALHTYKMPEFDDMNRWNTKNEYFFIVEVSQYKKGRHNDYSEVDSIISESDEWWIDAAVEDLVREGCEYSSFPNEIEHSDGGKVWIREDTDLVRITLWTRVKAEYHYFSSEGYKIHELGYDTPMDEVAIVIELSNDYVPATTEQPQQTGTSEADSNASDDRVNQSSTTNSESNSGDSAYPYNDYTDTDADDDSSDFDEMSTGEVAAGTAAATAVAVGVAAGLSDTDSDDDGDGNGDEERTFVLKDPATGAERLYIYDNATGEWISDDGRSVLDPDKIPQWQESRKGDRKAADKTMKKLRNRETEYDKRLSKDYHDRLAAQKHEEYVDKVGAHYNIYNGDEKAIREKVGQASAKAELEGYEQQELAGEYDKSVTKTEVIGKAADVGIDFIATYNPALKPGQYIYYGTRNITANVADARAFNKDMKSALRKGLGETIVDISQASVDKLGYKFVANTVGDTAKEVFKSIDEGKISAEDFTNAAIKGTTTGTIKTGIAAIFKSAEKIFKPKTVNALSEKATVKLDDSIKNITKDASQGRLNLLGEYQGGAISKNVYDGAKSALNTKYVADVRQAKAWAENYSKSFEKQSAAKIENGYSAVSGMIENATNDIATGNNPFKR